MTNKKIKNVFIFLLLSLPLLIILFAIFRNGALDINNAFDFVSNNFFDYIPNYFESLHTWFVTNLDLQSTAFDFIFNYLVYVFFVEFTSLLFDFILFIPKWLKGVFFKYEND